MDCCIIIKLRVQGTIPPDEKGPMLTSLEQFNNIFEKNKLNDKWQRTGVLSFDAMHMTQGSNCQTVT